MNELKIDENEMGSTSPNSKIETVIANRSVGYVGKSETIFELQGLPLIRKIASVALPPRKPKLSNDGPDGKKIASVILVDLTGQNFVKTWRVSIATPFYQQNSITPPPLPKSQPPYKYK